MFGSVLTRQTFGDTNNPHIVFIHGWGNHSRVWCGLIEALEKSYCIHTFDLPGYGKNRAVEHSWQGQELVESLVDVIPENAVWCGWSLGGMIAVAIAKHLSKQSPKRIQALITIASNPKFVQDNTWQQAMPESVFQAFYAGLQSSPERTLKRFQNLIAKGSIDEKINLQTIKKINNEVAVPALNVLTKSLRLLNDMDMRSAINEINCPQLHLFGEYDALVPVSVRRDVQSLNKDAQISVLPGAGHVPHISHPLSLAEKLDSFIKEHLAEEQCVVTASDG